MIRLKQFNSLRANARAVVFALIAAIGASQVCAAPPPASTAFVITNFGAVGDGVTLNTKAIQTAIDKCSASGGGSLVVPAGAFLTGSIFLKQGVNIHLDKDAVLKGSQDTNDYPWINTRIAGLEMKWPAALVNADGLSHAVLDGDGVIDGSGLRWWNDYWAARAKETDGTDPHFKVPRPRLVHFINCTNLLVKDVLLRNAAFWTLQLTYCDHVEVRHLTVRNPRLPVRAASSDGIDVDSSRNVLITGCDIVCADDGICLKSGRDADGLRVNRPTENVEIRDCRSGDSDGMVSLGSETSGGIRHVHVINCRADDHCACVARFKSRMGRGGVIEDIVFDNIKADDVRSVLNFSMDSYGTTWLPEEFRKMPPADIGTPVFRNITLRNLTATNAGTAGAIVGLPDIPVRNLTLENVNISARQGFTIRNAPGLRFINVTVNGKLLDAPKLSEADAPRGN